jgi:flagella basal body P-ring formation protein FlgA
VIRPVPTIIPIIVFLAALSFTQSALGQARLRTQSVVENDVVTLGDLFTGVDELADQEIGPAPAPGRSATYKADHLVAIARAHGLEWRPAGISSRAVVSRGGAVVGEGEVVDLLRREFRQQGALGRIKIRLNRLRANVLRSHEGGGLRIDELTYDSDGGSFSGYIHSEISGDETQRLLLRGRVDFVARVPVLSRSIRKGEEISRSDLKMTDLNIRALGDDAIETIDHVVGLAANRNLRQNQPLKASDLRTPIMVAKGALVTVILKSGGLSLTSTGRALQDGSQGEIIRIMNMQSKRTVEASVMTPNNVRVELRRRIAVAVNK